VKKRGEVDSTCNSAADGKFQKKAKLRVVDRRTIMRHRCFDS
jgi:hypothetical protein